MNNFSSAEASGRQAATLRAAGIDTRQRDREFVALLDGYRATGGVARSNAMPQRWHAPEAGTELSLKSLVAARHVFHFHWHDSLWLPMFQFEPHGRRVAAESPQVLAELGTVFDGWALARWFVEPNSWLHEQKPIDLLHRQLPAVLAAARVDRYMATT